MSENNCRAFCHCPHLAHAVMVEEYVMTLLCSSLCWRVSRKNTARCHCSSLSPQMSQALILQVPFSYGPWNVQGCLFQGNELPPLPCTIIATVIRNEAISFYTKGKPCADPRRKLFLPRPGCIGFRVYVRLYWVLGLGFDLFFLGPAVLALGFEA